MNVRSLWRLDKFTMLRSTFWQTHSDTHARTLSWGFRANLGRGGYSILHILHRILQKWHWVVYLTKAVSDFKANLGMGGHWVKIGMMSPTPGLTCHILHTLHIILWKAITPPNPNHTIFYTYWKNMCPLLGGNVTRTGESIRDNSTHYKSIAHQPFWWLLNGYQDQVICKGRHF